MRRPTEAFLICPTSLANTPRPSPEVPKLLVGAGGVDPAACFSLTTRGALRPCCSTLGGLWVLELTTPRHSKLYVKPTCWKALLHRRCLQSEGTAETKLHATRARQTTTWLRPQMLQETSSNSKLKMQWIQLTSQGPLPTILMKSEFSMHPSSSVDAPML